jgi:Trypsin
MRLLALGYGYTETHSVGQLMQGTIPVASAGCVEPVLRPYCLPYAEMVLTSRGTAGRQNDTCKGDSGGPVFLVGDDKYKLVAVTSRPAPFLQPDPSLQCGGGGIYEILARQVVQDWFDANGVLPAQTRTVQRTLATR